jgi:hypothetical protein
MALQQSAIHTGISTANAGQRSLAQLQQLGDTQAIVLAFISAFFVLGVIVALLVPLPFLMKQPLPEEIATSQGMH